MSTPSQFDLEQYLGARKAWVEAELSRLSAPCDDVPARLTEAMAYSLLAGGKRLRPILALAGYEAACQSSGRSADLSVALPLACAVEMIHTYSLIHDDLPAMDNDDFRRGRPTNHKVFGEAVAILAGDALLTESFAVAARCPAPAEAVVAAMAMLAQASGAAGMVGGQVIDFSATGQKVGVEALRRLHRLKTGALLSVSLCAGARLACSSQAVLDGLRHYGEALGLAFQIIDDVLDVTADLATLGKDPGSDAKKGKTTYVDLLGIDGARRHAREVMDAGLASIAALGSSAAPLVALANYTVERRN
ncbi:MAG: polyprenyl synthetase family protein [Myxococcales bacterium]|nr:polyprenyl synthetase family protein [Myxococcales bacterium]